MKINFNIYSTGKFIFAWFVIFFLTIAYEALKQYRELLFHQAQRAREIQMKQSDGTLVRTMPKLTLRVS